MSYGEALGSFYISWQTMKYIQETMPVLERFVVLICDDTSRSQRVTHARNVLSICAEDKNPWELLSTDHALFQYTKRVGYKDGHCWGQCFEWERSRGQGNHKSQMRGNLYAPPYCKHQKCNYHYHGDEGWGQRRRCSLNDLKLCQTSGKSMDDFPSQEKLIQTWVQRYSHPSP